MYQEIIISMACNVTKKRTLTDMSSEEFLASLQIAPECRTKIECA